MGTNEVVTVLCSLAGSLLVWWGGYLAFKAKTEEWRASVKERFDRIDERYEKTEKVIELLRKRSHRHASRILTHELEIDQVMYKLGVQRSRRRDDSGEADELP